MVWFNHTHLFPNLQAKFFQIYVLYFGQIYSELCKFRAIRPKYPAPFIDTLCFRCLTSGRELPKIPANYADSVQFTHNFRESREIHTIC